MIDWITEFYNNVWHRYWTLADLFITFYILYQLRKLNSYIDHRKDKKKDDSHRIN